MLGSRRRIAPPGLLVTLQDNCAASLTIHPDKSASPKYRACRGERNEESLEDRESIQVGLLPDRLNGRRLQGEQCVLQDLASVLNCECAVNSLIGRDAPLWPDRRPPGLCDINRRGNVARPMARG